MRRIVEERWRIGISWRAPTHPEDRAARRERRDAAHLHGLVRDLVPTSLGFESYRSDSWEKFEFLKSLFAKAETNDNIYAYYIDTYQPLESIDDEMTDISFHALKVPSNTWTEASDMYVSISQYIFI